MKKSILLILVLVILSASIPLFASNYYEKGNSFFNINVGPTLPFLLVFPQSEGEAPYVGMENTKIKVGGVGSISYQACVSPVFAIGGEIGYGFNYVYDKIFTQVPLSAKVTCIPVQTGKFDININANLGVSILRYYDIKPVITPFASFTINPEVYITENWGLGVQGGISAVAELTKIKENKAIFAEFPISVTLSYRR